MDRVADTSNTHTVHGHGTSSRQDEVSRLQAEITSLEQEILLMSQNLGPMSHGPNVHMQPTGYSASTPSPNTRPIVRQDVVLESPPVLSQIVT